MQVSANTGESGKLRHFPRDVSPLHGSHAIQIASSTHKPMQCSSLPHASGTVRTASSACITKHLGPHASAHRPQPVHLSSSTMGIHLWVNFISHRSGQDCYITSREAVGRGGGSINVMPRLSANITTAPNSATADTGRTLQAACRLPS